MEKSFKTAREYCEQGRKDKLINYFSFFPERTLQKLRVMVDEVFRLNIFSIIIDRMVNA